MPLDPNKISRKRPRLRPDILFAAEWSAIIFAGMLAVLFLAWALALQMPETGKFTTGEPSQATGDSTPFQY